MRICGSADHRNSGGPPARLPQSGDEEYVDTSFALADVSFSLQTFRPLQTRIAIASPAWGLPKPHEAARRRYLRGPFNNGRHAPAWPPGATRPPRRPGPGCEIPKTL